MAARLVIGGPPAEPRDVVPGQIFPLAVAPGLGERPLERPAVDRVSHQPGHASIIDLDESEHSIEKMGPDVTDDQVPPFLREGN